MEPVQQVIDRAIRSSTGAWFESRHCKIYGKDRSKGTFTPKQNYLQSLAQRVMDKMEDLDLPIRIMGLKPRQKGSTTYFTATAYTKLRRESTSGVLIGGQFAQVKEAWEMMETYGKNDTFDWKNTGEINNTTGEWSNGSKLIKETAGDLVAGIGGTHQLVHAFEVARWGEHGVSNAADVLANLLKSVPRLPNTVVILESTAEGATGDFYTRFVDAIDAEDFLSGKIIPRAGSYVRLFAAFFQFSDSAIRLTDDEKNEIQMTLDANEEWDGERELIEEFGVVGEDGITRLGETVKDFDVWEQLAWRRYAIHEECKKDKEIFNRDYPSSWKKAFQKSGGMRFNGRALEKIDRRCKQNTAIHGVIEEGKNRVVFRPCEAGVATTTIFEKPRNGYRYILSCDPMTGETQVGSLIPDNHGVFVLRAGFWDTSGKWVRPCTAARLVPNIWDIDVEEEHLWRLARYYGNASGCKIVVEMNMDRGLVELLKLRSADIYQREIFNQREFRLTKALGYQTNPKTREKLVDTLAKAIREYDTPGEGIDILCPIARAQCENFVRKKSGRSEAAIGWKDDDVFAIALGLEVIEHATTYVAAANIFSMPPDLRGTGENQSGRSPYS